MSEEESAYVVMGAGNGVSQPVRIVMSEGLAKSVVEAFRAQHPEVAWTYEKVPIASGFVPGETMALEGAERLTSVDGLAEPLVLTIAGPLTARSESEIVDDAIGVSAFA